MSASLLIWWQGRTPRERILLLLLGAIVAAVLLWLAVLRPLGEARENAAQRRRIAEASLPSIRSDAAEVEALQKQRRTLPRSTSPMQAVSSSAAAAGFALRTIEEQPGGVRVVIDAARPQALFGWIAGLERQGILAASLTATPNGDRSLAADLTFRTAAQPR